MNMTTPRAAFSPPLPSTFLRSTLALHHRRARPAQPARRRRLHPRATLPTGFPPRHTPPSPTHQNRAPDYYANVGTVIDTLRNDVPQMLLRPPDFSIYTDSVTFSDGSGYRIRGKDAYKTVLWLLRAQARLVFTTAFVEVMSMYHDDCEGCVYLRWRMSANARWSGMGRCVIDGMSVYRLDCRGWVYDHSLENASRRRGRRVAFDGLNAQEARVVGAGVGAGGLPGWYPSDLSGATELLRAEDVEQAVGEEVR